MKQFHSYAAINSTCKLYAPDRRTALFDVAVNGKVVSGETNIPEAKAALLQALPTGYIDSIRILPDTALDQNTTAIVSISVAKRTTTLY